MVARSRLVFLMTPSQAKLPSSIQPPLLDTPCLRRSEEHTSELQSQSNLVCRLLLENKKLHALTALPEDAAGDAAELRARGKLVGHVRRPFTAVVDVRVGAEEDDACRIPPLESVDSL